MIREFYIRLAGITIRFISQLPMEIPHDLEPFVISPAQPDETYEIRLLHEPLSFTESPVYSTPLLRVYREQGGCTRVFPSQTAKDGCSVACTIRENGCHTIYLPGSAAACFQTRCSFAGMLVPELLLMRHDSFLLHSSVVTLHGKAVLFSGPSHIGKSTQAELWRTCFGAEVINGDRCVISRRSDGFWGSGSPYCGSSGIRIPAEAPIEAIVLLGQAADNTITRVSPQKALRTLYRETVQNTWDEAYTQRQLILLSQLVQAVPVYSLKCRPDSDAAFLTNQTIFSEAFL